MKKLEGNKIKKLKAEFEDKDGNLFYNIEAVLGEVSNEYKFFLYELAKQLKEFGGENCLSLKFYYPKLKRNIEVVIRYIDGKMPGEIVVELEDNIKKIREFVQKNANESEKYKKISKNRKRRWIEGGINAMANETLEFIGKEVLK